MGASSAQRIGQPRAGFLDRSRIVAPPGFNRWLVPPAALAIHLCIGMVYGFSVFWLPLSRALGVTKPVACAAGSGLVDALFSRGCDWKISDLTWIFTLAIVFLGSAAALWGGWLERAGPRRAGVVAALCWCGGLVGMAVGVQLHQLWLMWLFGGVVGGVGLGIGYISPVSTLIKWFPDRRGMATGMAIMGFGGGAMIGAPLANLLMSRFRGPDSVGVWQTLLVLAGLYLVFMLGGALAYRVPAPGWRPAGWTPSAASARRLSHSVHLRDAPRTAQFWLIWGVLCLNVSAGIGVLAMASPMLQEIFAGRLIGQPDLAFTALSDPQRAAIAAVAAGFTGLLSLFNIGGRFFWASLSDRLGRRPTYAVFFLLGIVLYAGAPSAAHAGLLPVFVLALCVILSMYGGGFATVPAYLADIFGTEYVGAIHGRLLTAWSVAGVIGPLLISYVREAELGAGVPRALAYDVTFYFLAALLLGGLVCNLLVRPLPERWFMAPHAMPAEAGATAAAPATGGRSTAVVLWLAVGLPILWGVWMTLRQVSALL
jgi:MFS family permease